MLCVLCVLLWRGDSSGMSDDSDVELSDGWNDISDGLSVRDVAVDVAVSVGVVSVRDGVVRVSVANRHTSGVVPCGGMVPCSCVMACFAALCLWRRTKPQRRDEPEESYRGQTCDMDVRT